MYVGGILSAADPAQSPTPPRWEWCLESPEGQSLGVRGWRPVSPSPHVRPIHVPWGSQTGPRCWPLWCWGTRCAGPAAAAFWAPAGPRRPRGARGTARGRPRSQPRPSAWRPAAPTSAAAQPCTQVRPRALMGATQPALRVPAQRHDPGGRLAAADACLRGTSSGSTGNTTGGGRRRRERRAPVPAGQDCGGLPWRVQCPRRRRRRQINPPLRPEAGGLQGGGLTWTIRQLALRLARGRGRGRAPPLTSVSVLVLRSQVAAAVLHLLRPSHRLWKQHLFQPAPLSRRTTHPGNH